MTIKASQDIVFRYWPSTLRWINHFEDPQDHFGATQSLKRYGLPSSINQCRIVNIPENIGVGYWEMIEFVDGFGMAINNANYHSTNVLSFEGEDLLKFHFRIEAQSSLYVDPIGLVELEGAVCQVFYHPKGIVNYEWVDVGPVDSWISIYCKPDYLTNVLGFDTKCLPSELIQSMEHSNPEPFVEHFPMSLALRQCCTEISHCHYTGVIRSRYFEAQAIKLLCETFDKLKPDSQEQNLNLCQKDIKAIHNAFNILQEQFAHPPSIVSLSREVGVNRNKLLAGFKSLFGITIQAHCLRKRMEVGKDLLLTSDQPISKISEAVGYDHPNNFSSAFRRFYGVSPKLARGKFTPSTSCQKH